ncbi:effector-associated domain 2-containing protein [Actinomadura coerulea]|uniref:VMAP-C domain-containing protein n=1 Tax=Actinomadura coerulea TaxID=46159 RepID=UPI0034302A58
MADEESRWRALVPSASLSLGHAQEQVLAEQTTADIVALLLDIPDMREAAARSIVLHYISEHVRAPVLLPDLPQPRYYLYHLVLACREIPDGLQLLVRAIEFVAGPTAAVAHLKRMLSPVRAHLEPVVETQIEDLLTDLRIPSLTRLYVAATGNGIATVPFRLTDAWDAFSALLDHNTAPGKPSPHLIFVAMLLQTMQTRQTAGSAGTEEAWRLKRLREWLALQTEQLRGAGDVAQADYLDRMRDRSGVLATRADKPIYLIIQLEPLPDLVEDEVMCRLSHWRQIHPLEWRPEPGDDKVVRLSEVREHVGALIHEAERGWAYELDDSLVLEFVLPLDMINLDVDQWTRDASEMPDPPPLGAEYEILVRSQERLRALGLHRAWRQRWQVLVDAVDGLTYWAAAGEPAHPRPMGDRLLSSREIVACVLSGPPDREPGRGELWKALRAGVPVVLWHRADRLAPEMREAVRQVVDRPDIRALPTDIRRLRGNAPSHDGNGRSALEVTLLWDDPNHFLDDARALRAPAART